MGQGRTKDASRRHLPDGFGVQTAAAVDDGCLCIVLVLREGPVFAW